MKEARSDGIYFLLVFVLAAFWATTVVAASPSDFDVPDDTALDSPGIGEARLELVGPALNLSDMSMALRAARININGGRGAIDLGVGGGIATSLGSAQGNVEPGDGRDEPGMAPTFMLRANF